MRRRSRRKRSVLDAVAWIYTHTRGDGQGLPDDATYPDLTPAIRRCLASDRPDSLIRTQQDDARKIGITATPTLRVLDHHSGGSLVLSGPVEGDALLSAIDWLAENSAEETSRDSARR